MKRTAKPVTYLKRVELASLYGLDVVTAFVTEHPDGSATVSYGCGNAVYPAGTWRVVGEACSELWNSYGGL